MKTFDDRLQMALTALENGATLEQALVDVPAHQVEEMRDLLRLARAVQRMEHPQAAPVPVSRLISRATESQRPPLTRQVYALAVTAVMVLIFVGLFVLRPLWELTQQDAASDGPRIAPTSTLDSLDERLAPTLTATPTDETGPEESLLRLSDDPVLRNGSSGVWDGVLTEPFAVVEDGSTLYMFRSGQNAGPESAIGLSRASEAGWESVSADAILSISQELGVLLPGGSVTGEGAGRWSMLLALSQEADYLAPASIYRASAPAPEGPWTLDEAPLLGPSGVGWDSQRVFSPVLLEHDGLWWLFYTGMDADFRQSIGAATSSDGETWTRMSSPLITMGDVPADDDAFLTLMDVVVQDGAFVLLYRVSPTLASVGDVYGLATSANGADWQISPSPLLDRRDLSSVRGLYQAELRPLPAGGLELYFGMATGAGITTNIWQAQLNRP